MALVLNGDNGIVYTNLNQDIRSLLMPKNWIINGMFDVWQRGTTQTTSGYGSDDRFSNDNVGTTKINSRQAFTIGQTEVPNNPTYFNRTTVSSLVGVGNYTLKSQVIEDVSKLAGKTITLSFWAKADANKNISIEFAQYFGTGGSTFLKSLNVQKFALTASWQRFTKTITLPSVSGKTIGSGSGTVLYLWFDAGSNYNASTNSLGNQSGTFDIANVSLVEGSVAVECQNQPYADVLRECKHYYKEISLGSTGRLPITVSAGSATSAVIPLVDLMRITPVASVKTNPTLKLVRDANDSNDGTFTTVTLYSYPNFIEISVNVVVVNAQQMLLSNLVIALNAEL